MRITINNKFILYSSIEFTADNTQLARSFKITIQDNTIAYNVLDDVSIYHMDQLALCGVIEAVEFEQDNNASVVVYYGRSNARYAIDSYVDKTYQITPKQNLAKALNTLISKYGIKAYGSYIMPTDASYIFNAGDKVGHNILKLCANVGVFITTDATGNILLNKDYTKSDLVLEYGANIISREYIVRVDNLYDSYSVISQFKDRDTTAHLGNKTHKKVIYANSNLTNIECLELAKFMHLKDKLNSKLYTITTDETLELNSSYKVIDKPLKLEAYLKVRAVHILIDVANSIYKKTYTLEHVDV